MSIRILILSLLCIAASTDLLAVTFTAGSVGGQRGGTVVVPVSIVAGVGEQPAGMNYDLTFDPNVLTYVSFADGSAATAAGKSGTASTPSSGLVRVVIFGLNANVIANGVISNITFTINPSAPFGSSSIGFSSIVVANPKSQTIPNNSGTPGTVTVSSSPPVTIGAGSTTTFRNETIVIPVSLTYPAGGQPAGINFDMTFDPNVLTYVSYVDGPATTAASKAGAASLIGGSAVRIVIFGLNANVIAPGVLGNVTFTVNASAPFAPSQLGITNISVSDPSAAVISGNTGTPGTVTVQDIPPTFIGVTYDVQTVPSGSFPLEVSLDAVAAASVATASFTINFNPSHITYSSIAGGAQSIAAGKTVSAALASAGVLNVTITGSPATGIDNGILAVVNLTAVSTLTGGLNSSVSFANLSATSPSSATVPNLVSDTVEVTVLQVAVHANTAANTTRIGQQYSVPLSLAQFASGGNVVAGLQTDVVFDSAVFEYVSATAGPVAAAASKSVTASVVAGTTNRLRVVLFGLNVNTMADGIWATLVFNVKAAAPIGPTVLDVQDIVATNGSAQSISFAGGFAKDVEITAFEVEDVNRDGIVNVVDVQLTINLILTIATPTYQGQGDVNGDGLRNVVDVQRVVIRFLGI